MTSRYDIQCDIPKLSLLDLNTTSVSFWWWGENLFWFLPSKHLQKLLSKSFKTGLNLTTHHYQSDPNTKGFLFIGSYMAIDILKYQTYTLVAPQSTIWCENQNHTEIRMCFFFWTRVEIWTIPINSYASTVIFKTRP